LGRVSERDAALGFFAVVFAPDPGRAAVSGWPVLPENLAEKTFLLPHSCHEFRALSGHTERQDGTRAPSDYPARLLETEPEHPLKGLRP
jgi:hypothetical protein